MQLRNALTPLLLGGENITLPQILEIAKQTRTAVADTPTCGVTRLRSVNIMTLTAKSDPIVAHNIICQSAIAFALLEFAATTQSNRPFPLVQLLDGFADENDDASAFVKWLANTFAERHTAILVDWLLLLAGAYADNSQLNESTQIPKAADQQLRSHAGTNTQMLLAAAKANAQNNADHQRAEAVHMLRELWIACIRQESYEYRAQIGMDAVVAHLTYINNIPRSAVYPASADHAHPVAHHLDAHMPNEPEMQPNEFKRNLEYVLAFAKDATEVVMGNNVASTNPFSLHAQVSDTVETQFQIVKMLMKAVSQEPDHALSDDRLPEIASFITTKFRDETNWPLAVDFLLMMQGGIFLASSLIVQLQRRLLEVFKDDDTTTTTLSRLSSFNSDPVIAKYRSIPMYAAAVDMIRNLWNACNNNEEYTYAGTTGQDESGQVKRGMDYVIAHLEYICKLSDQPQIPAAASMPSVADRQMMHQIFGSMQANRLRQGRRWLMRGQGQRQGQSRSQSRGQRRGRGQSQRRSRGRRTRSRSQRSGHRARPASRTSSRASTKNRIRRRSNAQATSRGRQTRRSLSRRSLSRRSTRRSLSRQSTRRSRKP